MVKEVDQDQKQSIIKYGAKTGTLSLERKKMTLSELAKKYDTDKNTDHSYIDKIYEKLFPTYKDSAQNILEIGILKGGSILLWEEYFQNANIHCVDVSKSNIEDKSNYNRIKAFRADAYSDKFISTLTDNFYDIIIDDGPHTLYSMIIFVSKYLKKVKSKGLLIVEDIPDIAWFEILRTHIKNEMQQSVIFYDLRQSKNRHDDMVLIIEKK